MNRTAGESRSLRSGSESFEGGANEGRQRGDVVPTLEHGRRSRREADRASRQLAKPGLRDEHLRDRILLVGVEACREDRKSTRLNSSHTEIYTLSLHDALPIFSARGRPSVAPARETRPP